MLLFKCFCVCFDFAKCRHECPSHNGPAALRCFFSASSQRDVGKKISFRFRRFGLNVSLLISHARCNCCSRRIMLSFFLSFFFKSPEARVSTNPSTELIWMLKQMLLSSKRKKTKFSGIIFFCFVSLRFFSSLLRAPWGGARTKDPDLPLLAA